jgi:hypothetical protein
MVAFCNDSAMTKFATSRAIEAALKSHLASQGRGAAFVNVQQMPGRKGDLIYIITTESSLASLLQSFIERRIGRDCPYTQGSFLLHGADAERLLA